MRTVLLLVTALTLIPGCRAQDEEVGALSDADLVALSKTIAPPPGSPMSVKLTYDVGLLELGEACPNSAVGLQSANMDALRACPTSLKFQIFDSETNDTPAEVVTATAWTTEYVLIYNQELGTQLAVRIEADVDLKNRATKTDYWFNIIINDSAIKVPRKPVPYDLGSRYSSIRRYTPFAIPARTHDDVQPMGDHEYCGLSAHVNVHGKKPCICHIERENDQWVLKMRTDESVGGKCGCAALCID